MRSFWGFHEIVELVKAAPEILSRRNIVKITSMDFVELEVLSLVYSM